MIGKYIVRYGAMHFMGEFEADEEMGYTRGSQVIVRSDRGEEMGEVLCHTTPRALEMITDPKNGQIVRRVNSDDLQTLERLREQERNEFEVCRRFIQQRQLPMELVDVEHLIGGERIIFYFLSENRVDFRDLVKDLAREFQTRIEMRQIGVRDEAKLLADFGDCGKSCCCNTHLAEMPPVSMRMAKLQKSTLDPSKISGRCGRLKCCLRYEQNVYEDFQKELPPVGSRVLTQKGQGRVLSQEILAKKLMVEFEDGRRLPVAADEVLTRLGK